MTPSTTIQALTCLDPVEMLSKCQTSSSEEHGLLLHGPRGRRCWRVRLEREIRKRTLSSMWRKMRWCGNMNSSLRPSVQVDGEINHCSQPWRIIVVGQLILDLFAESLDENSWQRCLFPHGVRCQGPKVHGILSIIRKKWLLWCGVEICPKRPFTSLSWFKTSLQKRED